MGNNLDNEDYELVESEEDYVITQGVVYTEAESVFDIANEFIEEQSFEIPEEFI